MTGEAKLTIRVNDINEHCPILVNFSSEPYLFLSRQRFQKRNHGEKLTYRLFAFDKDISDQSNITFELLPSTYSDLFSLSSNGLLTVNDLPPKLPSIIELDYVLQDQFVFQPCRREDKLILLIGEISADKDYLIDQYEKQLENSQHHRLMTQKLANTKRKKQETLFIFLAFSLSTLIILIGIVSLLFLICCRKEKNGQSIRRKSSSLMDDSKQQSPHSFLTDSNGKSSLLPPLR